MKNIEFQLTVDLIRKSLQGLEIELVVDDIRFKIHPPVKGILFEPSEIKRLKNAINGLNSSDKWQVLREFDEILKLKFTP